MSVDVVPFSAELWKEYNKSKSQDKDLYEVSHAGDVEKAIEKLQAEYWEQYAVALRDDYASLLAELSQSIDVRIAELKESSDINEKIQAHQERMMEIAKLKQELSDNSSGKRSRINEMIKESQEKILSEFQKESILLSTEKLRIIIDKFSHHKNGEELVIEEVDKSINNLHASIDQKLKSTLANIASAVGSEIHLPNVQHDGYKISKGQTTSQKPVSEKILDTAQNLWMPVTVGGGLLFTPFWPLGLVVGIGGVAAAIGRKKAAERTAEMVNHIQPHVTIAMNELRMYIQKKYETFSKILFEQLAASLDKLNEELKSIMAMLQKCEVDKKQRVEQVAALEQNKKFIDEQLIQTKAVGADPLSLNHAN